MRIEVRLVSGFIYEVFIWSFKNINMSLIIKGCEDIMVDILFNTYQVFIILWQHSNLVRLLPVCQKREKNGYKKKPYKVIY